MNNCMNYFLKLANGGAAATLRATESDFVVRINKFNGPYPTWPDKIKKISGFLST